MTLPGQLKVLFEIGHRLLVLRPDQTRPTAESTFQELMFASASGKDIRAFFAAPDGRLLAPAILYIHAHGDRYDIGAREVLDGRPALQGPQV